MKAASDYESMSRHGAKSGRVRAVIVTVVCLAFVAGSASQMLSIAGDQTELSRAGTWLYDAAEFRRLLDDVATEAESSANVDADWFLQRIPPRVKAELDSQALIMNMPVSEGQVGALADELLRAAVPVRTAMSWMADGSANPDILAEPARELADAIAQVLPSAAARVNRKAEELTSSKNWLYIATLVMALGAALLTVTNIRIRRGRDDLAAAFAAVRENEERYRQMFQLNHAVKLLLAPDDGKIVDANEAACRFYGVSLDQLKSRSLMDVSDQTNEAAQQLADFASSDGKVTTWMRHRLDDGRIRDVEMHTSPISVAGTRLIFAILLDVTDRVRAEEAVRESKARLSVTLRSIDDGVIGVDAEGNVQLMNAAAEALTGWSEKEALGRPLDEVYRIRDEETMRPVDDVAARVRTEEGHSGSYLLLDREGIEHVVEASGAPIQGSADGGGVVLAVRDVTEQRRLQRETERSRQLESLALLAGGIAHDFNNFLAGMVGNLQMARSEVKTETPAWDALTKAESATRHAQGLTRQLMTFAKGGGPLRRRAALGELIQETVEFALRGSDVKAEIDIAADLAAAEVDEGQINQVLHNLAINASQAMPHGGALTVRATNDTVSGADNLPLPAGAYVHIAVSDTGTGIPADDLERIFEPYFTTKKTGTGLGLASSYSIIRKHEGALTVESDAGVGTTFHIYLPASEAPVETPVATAMRGTVGGERILWADDDEQVRDMAERMLVRYGYRVETVPDGADAVRRYGEELGGDDAFDLVVLDVVIPDGMGGAEAVKHLIEIDSEARVVVTSGHTENEVIKDYVRYGFRGALPKPFTRADLASVIIDVLDTKVGEPGSEAA